MILKELDAFSSDDPMLKAGRKAEENMAFYLRRAFKDDEKLHVLNGVRVERDGEIAHIDHLVLHHFGFIVIESKSVTTQVDINENGEWVRWFANKPHGMRSPILQARGQAKLLGKYLDSHAETLLPKMLLGRLQQYFGWAAYDILVAISDTGIVKRPGSKAFPEVCKADAVPDKIRELYAKWRRLASPLNLNPLTAQPAFSNKTFEGVVAFILQSQSKGDSSTLVRMPAAPAMIRDSTSHPYDSAFVQPATLATNQTPAAPPPKKATIFPGVSPVCHHCHSPRLWVGCKDGYYFRCQDCRKTMPIRDICARCGREKKISREGPELRSTCESCDESRLAYTEPGASRPPVNPAVERRISPAYTSPKAVAVRPPTIFPDVTPVCRHCHSPRLWVGCKDGYYFRCQDCRKTTPIRDICARCGKEKKITQKGPELRSTCESCGDSRLAYTEPGASRPLVNPAVAKAVAGSQAVGVASLPPVNPAVERRISPAYTAPKAVPVRPPTIFPDVTPVCRHCRSPRLSVGQKYGFYFRCQDCAKAMPIRDICTRCGTEKKITKKGPEVWAICESCGDSRLAYTEPAAVQNSAGVRAGS